MFNVYYLKLNVMIFKYFYDIFVVNIVKWLCVGCISGKLWEQNFIFNIHSVDVCLFIFLTDVCQDCSPLTNYKTVNTTKIWRPVWPDNDEVELSFSKSQLKKLVKRKKCFLCFNINHKNSQTDWQTTLKRKCFHPNYQDITQNLKWLLLYLTLQNRFHLLSYKKP